MILTNRLNFFDKKGNEINMLPDAAVTATVMNPSGGGGAQFNVYTNRNGNIACFEIVSGGTNYVPGVSYIRFENVLTGYVWDTDPADLVISSGTIVGFSGLATGGIFASQNSGFPYPAVTWKGEMYFDLVSVGLIENQDIFVLEKVLKGYDINSLGYSFPRADEGPVNELGFFKNEKPVSFGAAPENGIGSVSVKVYSYTGNISTGNTVIYNLLTTANLVAGMAVEGPGIPSGTKIKEILSATSIEVTNTFTSTINTNPIEFYQPHNFVGGMMIRIGDSTFPLSISGTFEVQYVTEREIYFKTPIDLPTIPATVGFSTSFFRAAPVWRGRVVGSEPEIFLFTVDYQEDYPVITRNEINKINPIDSSLLSIPDIYYDSGNTLDNASNEYQYRSVSENWEEKLMQFHLGFSAGTEGSYVKLFSLEDITFPYAPVPIAQISLRGEAAGEDERLEKLLENFGREITEQQELILRDSDVNEDLPNYLLLNKKRKEMLLQGEQIWPYLGSYKGLVNIVNWFGYYDMRIKEYWLNVNKDDVYYGKYKQIQIPFQLEERGTPHTSIDMLPSKVYKKTNKFGLFYDLNKESGVLDENGMPLTVDSFQFSNEEILIKLFALKQYLVNTFLPLNAKIVDIVGEGVYYERYSANTWNDRVESLDIELTRSIDFEATSTRIPIEEARRFDPTQVAYSYSPGTDTLQNYYSTYTVKGVTVNSPVTPSSFLPILQLTTTSGNASPSQVWEGQAYVNAVSGSYVLSTLSEGGTGYQVGDIITLGGGTFSNPIRIKVTSVIPGGSITTFDVVSGLDQGSRYFSLPPTAFSQTYVISEDLTNNIYYAGVGTGLKLEITNIFYQLEGVKTTTQGKGYPVGDPLQLLVINPSSGVTHFIANCTFDLVTVQGPYVGYFSESKTLLPLTNEPNMPVGAFLDLKTLGLDAYWNDMLFSWTSLWGAEDATLKTYIDPLPAGAGTVLAIEIADPGSGYNLTPAIQIVGGQGINATAASKIVDGKLAKYEYAASSAVPLSPLSSRIYFNFSITPIPFSLGTMVTGVDAFGAEIPKPAVITFIDSAGTYIDISQNYTAGPLDIVIHEGARVTGAGSGYVAPPDAKTIGGHTEILYTWDEMGRGNFYEMEWRVDLETGTAPFTYTSGRGTIDSLINHTVQLPYKGLYRVELVIYDTENNWVNEIKRNYVEVYMPEAAATLATRFLGPSTTPGPNDGTESASMNTQLTQNCVDTWEEAFYKWDEYWGRWINPFKTWTTWTDCDIEWDTLYVSPNGTQNNWHYPIVPSFDVLQISAYDNLLGTVTSFDPGSGAVTVAFPTADEQRRPLILGSETVFFRRDDLLFQATASAATVVGSSYNFTISLSTNWPDNFEANPTAWEVLREVKNTLIVDDDLFTLGNGKTLVPGQFITLNGYADTPLNKSRWNLSQPTNTWGIPILGKTTSGGFDSGIEIDSGFSAYPYTTDSWVNGQIYQYRNNYDANGSLNLFASSTAATSGTVYIERLVAPTEYNWGNRGMIYINNTSGSSDVTTASPLSEIRPGFTYINLLVGNLTDGSTLYEQSFRTINMYEDTGNQGHPWGIWFETSNSSIICIEVETVDGKKFDEIIDKLGALNVDNNTQNNAWIEYKYNVFPTRSYYTQSGTNWEIEMDFNTKPILGAFEASSYFPATPVDGGGWYYDAAISSGNFALEVTNVGEYQNGSTIITVKDPNSELYRCDSTFVEQARDFDEDYAETHLGVKLAWSELYDLNWQAMCSQTWNSTDWPFQLYCNFTMFVSPDASTTNIRINENEPLYVSTANVVFPGSATNAAYVASLLNNNFYDPLGIIQKNENTALSKFYYEPYLLAAGFDQTGIFTWGNPSDSNIYGDSSLIINAGWYAYSHFINPGWYVSTSIFGTTTLTNSGTIGTALPWIPACQFCADITAGSRTLKNITGFLATNPQAGWIWDPVGSAVIGEFGPGKGKIVEENGFVTSIEMDIPATISATQFAFELYPYRSGIVKFFDGGVESAIIASSKNPGTDTLGYVRTDTGSNLIRFFPNHAYLPDYLTGLTTAFTHTMPLGNYYNWVKDLDVFYGGGLEDTPLQFAQGYRNIQSYIQEGGENRVYNAENGGWYPSITWGSPGFTDGAAFAQNGASGVLPLSENALYKPIYKIRVFDENMNELVFPVPNNSMYLITDVYYDGYAGLYMGPSNATSSVGLSELLFNIFFPGTIAGSTLYIEIQDQSGNGTSQKFSVQLVDITNGLLGKNVTYFYGQYQGLTSPPLSYDPDSYQIRDLISYGPAGAPASYESISKGMVVGYFGVGGGFEPTQSMNTRVVDIDYENRILYMSNNNKTGSTFYTQLYAYTPLDLNIKIQPITNVIWSRTKQWDSMRLPYEASFNGAFTWEDSTVSIREKKIPAGSSVLFSSDASDIAGKTGFLWNLYHEGTKLVSVTDPSFLWTFLEPGDYDLELEITDTNGNKQNKYNKTFVEVYLAEQTGINS
jgi:hypothetical protein